MGIWVQARNDFAIYKNLRREGGFSGGPVTKTAFRCRSCRFSPSQGAKIPTCLSAKKQNIKQKQYCNKFNKDLKKWSTSKKKKNSQGKFNQDN